MKSPMSILVLVLLLASGFFVLDAPFIPKAHAVGPTLITSCNQITGAPVSSAQCTATVTHGDFLVFAILLWADAASCPPALSNGYPQDNKGGTYTRVYDSGCQQQVALGGMQVYYYTGTAGTSGVTAFTAQTVSPLETIGIMVFDWAALPAQTVVGTSTVSGVAAAVPHSYATTSSIDYGTAVPISAIIMGAGPNGAAAMTAGTGYTLVEGSCGSACFGEGFEYTTSTSVIGPTNFPWTQNAGSSGFPFFAAGIVIGTSAPTIDIVAACNFFQLQCWMYPMFFMGTYLGFFIGLAAAAEVSEKAFLYLLLSGATIASLIEVDMGIMTAMVPVMLITLNIVYSFRLDQRIINAVTNSGKGGTST